MPFAVFTDGGPEFAYLRWLPDARHTMALAIEDFDDFYPGPGESSNRYDLGALCIERFAVQEPRRGRQGETI